MTSIIIQTEFFLTQAQKRRTPKFDPIDSKSKNFHFSTDTFMTSRAPYWTAARMRRTSSMLTDLWETPFMLSIWSEDSPSTFLVWSRISRRMTGKVNDHSLVRTESITCSLSIIGAIWANKISPDCFVITWSSENAIISQLKQYK